MVITGNMSAWPIWNIEPLPGGDLTARKPYRMALVYLLATLGEEGADIAEQLLPALGGEERDIMLQRWQKGQPEIQTSSCGRLFDAVAALLGICAVNHYEGQAAMELEARCRCRGKRSLWISTAKRWVHVANGCIADVGRRC